MDYSWPQNYYQLPFWGEDEVFLLVNLVLVDTQQEMSGGVSTRDIQVSRKKQAWLDDLYYISDEFYFSHYFFLIFALQYYLVSRIYNIYTHYVLLFQTHFGTFLLHQPVKWRFLWVCFQCFFFPVDSTPFRKTHVNPGGCTSLGSNWSRFIRALRIEECGGLVVEPKIAETPEMVFWNWKNRLKTHNRYNILYIYVYIHYTLNII